MFSSGQHSGAGSGVGPEVASPGSQATSSKAVLAALRTLQDKIRRLEAERVDALHEASELRQQLKNQEIESEQLRQRDNGVAQKNIADARMAYDRLVEAKTELDTRIARTDDRNKEAQRLSEELTNKIRTIETDKQSAAIKVSELEAARRNLETQIQHVQQKERDLAQTIAWETKRHEDEMSSINGNLHALQDDLTAACHEKNAHDAKLAELDMLVGQLLAVNEALVAQLTGKPKGSSPKSAATFAPSSATSTRRRLTQQSLTSSAPASSASASSSSFSQRKPRGPVFVPRVAYEKTASTQRGERAKYVDESAARRMYQSGSRRSGQVAGHAQDLKEMHKMYSDIVRDMDMSDSQDDDEDEDEDVDEDDDEEEYDDDRAGEEERHALEEDFRRYQSNKKNGNRSSSSSRGNGRPATAPTATASATTKGGGSSSSGSSSSSRSKSRGAAADGAFGNERYAATRHVLKQQQALGRSILPDPPASVADLVKQANRLNADAAQLQERSQAVGHPSHSHLPPPAAPRDWTYTRTNPEADLRGVIDSLEQEFRSLDREYNSIINNPGVGASDELFSLISKMHAKGAQLRSLRSPEKLGQ